MTLTEAPPAVAPKSAEDFGGHWYEYADGVWTALHKEEGTFTLRDARILKESGRAVVPSVTTKFKVLHKQQVFDWALDNVAKTCLRTPRSEYASDDDYIEHVRAVSGDLSRPAAELGGRIHKAIEKWVRGEDYDAQYRLYVEAVVSARTQYNIGNSHPEEIVGSLEYGYAGRCDDYTDDMTVLDYKSRKSGGRYRTNKVASYPTDRMQLAAYGYAKFGAQFFMKGRGLVFAISTTAPGLVTVHEFSGMELVPAFEAFLALGTVWRFENKFDGRIRQ